MSDFLNFKSFISPYVLIIFYYIGAVFIPVASWFVTQRARRKYPSLSRAVDTGKEAARSVISSRYRGWFIAAFVMMFIMMEIAWRMMFEFMIAYFQMREALIGLTL